MIKANPLHLVYDPTDDGTEAEFTSKLLFDFDGTEGIYVFLEYDSSLKFWDEYEK